MNTKNILQSKTFWLNVAAIIVAIVNQQNPELINLSPDIIVLITAVLNIGMRLVTKRPVSILGGEKESA